MVLSSKNLFTSSFMSIVIGVIVMGTATSIYASEKGYYRTPTMYGDTVVFSSEGDLWKANTAGGDAFRLTTHPEEELSPHISPDGKWIAFAASYDGGVEAYVMPIEGGAPKQVSFDDSYISVRGWTPDGQVIYTSTSISGASTRVLRTVDPETLLEKEIPLLNANEASFADNGNDLFFTRFGLANNRDNAKQYRGGGMSQLWHFNVNKTAEAQRLAPKFGAPIRHPMWADGRIYFVSDKEGTGNIWSMNEKGKNLKQHTNHEGWDIKSPQLTDGVIIYQLGADIHMFTIATNTDSKFDVSIVSDQDYKRQHWVDKPLNFLTSANFGTEGKHVALSARGRVALASPGALRRVDFDIPGTARARSAVVGASDKWVYAILDAENGGEIWRYPLNGIGEAKQMTFDATAHRWRLYPSPNGKYIIHDDKDAQLSLLNLDDGTNRVIEKSEGFSDDAFSDITWSEDGRYVAFTTADKRSISQVVVYDLETGKRESVTTDKYYSYAPAFADDGKWLYFLSDRTFTPTRGSPWGDRNLGPFFDKRTKIYGLALDASATFPFAADNELTLNLAKLEQQEKKSEKENKEESGDTDNGLESDEKSDKESENVKEIDWDGLTKRLYEVPVPASNYANLKLGNGYLFVQERTNGTTDLKSLKISNENSKLKTFAGNVRQFALSGDGKHLFYSLGGRTNTGRMYIVKAGATAPKDLSTAQLRTKDWRLAINPQEEWRQIFLDVWRLHRDFAFDPNLRGIDWDGVRKKYEPLLATIGHRGELNDLIGQMTSELGILHSQIGAGDVPRDTENSVASSLGGVYTPHKYGLEITHIFQTEADRPSNSAPLAQTGVDVKVGDVITALNGRTVKSEADLSSSLAYQAGQQVIVNLRRDKEDHQVIVTPTSLRSEGQLRYSDWVENKRDEVASLGKGDVGYLHLRAMGGNDIASFARDFYEHYDKEGLIIDVRGNRGGSIDSWLIEKLLRRTWAFWHFNGRPTPYSNMQQSFRGHLVVLIDQATYSDGETFAAGVKALELGTLIGTRTAGAGIWLSDRNRLADGGIARVAESPQFGLDGRWLIEGKGVSPDITVDNLPSASYKGKDAQLEAAIKHLQAEIKKKPLQIFKAKPIPAVGTTAQSVK